MWINVCFLLVVFLTPGEQSADGAFFLDPGYHLEVQNDFLSPDTVKKALETVYLATNTFADARHSEKFVVTFLKMTPASLVNTLKGISIVAGVVAALIPLPSESEMVMRTIRKGFNAVFARLDRMAVEFEAVLNKKLFQEGPYETVSRASVYMKVYKNSPNDTTSKDHFLKHSEYRELDEAVNRILGQAPDMLSTITLSSRYNRTQFDLVCSTLSQTFYEAFVIKFYRIGVEYERFADKFAAEQEFAAKEFEELRNQLEVIIKKAIENFESNFFHAVTVEDIIVPAINAIMDKTYEEVEPKYWNWGISDNIRITLERRYPWRKFGVVAADQWKNGEYAYFGVKERSIWHEHRGKVVVVFMASKTFEDLKTSFLANNEKESIVREGMTKYNDNDLYHVLDFARKKNTYQIAVFFEISHPYFRQDETTSNFTTAFNHEVTRHEDFFNPAYQTYLNFYVVF